MLHRTLNQHYCRERWPLPIRPVLDEQSPVSSQEHLQKAAMGPARKGSFRYTRGVSSTPIQQSRARLRAEIEQKQRVSEFS